IAANHTGAVLPFPLFEHGSKHNLLSTERLNLNAYAERFVHTTKESCLEQVIFFGEDALRNTIREFLTHYHLERNHQGLENRLLTVSENVAAAAGPVRKPERVGGLLNYYYREAA